jgi:hypothetical protein
MDDDVHRFFSDLEMHGVSKDSRLRALIRKLDMRVTATPGKLARFIADCLRELFEERYLATKYWATGKR